MPDLPTGTVTFLFTDIEGSTQLLHALGERYGEVLATQRELLREAVRAHGGTEVDNQGDAFFFAFPRARDALMAAAQGQQALAAHEWPDGISVRVRMGLHTGEPHLGSTGYVGMDIHRAARIAAAGHGGQVLLSEVTYALATHDLPAGASLRDLGMHRLKDLQQPERIFQLVLPDLPADFSPLKTLDARPNNLPIQPTLLLGREEPLAAVCALLRREDVRLVTLTGPGGIGKTRLSIQVAAELVDEFADGVWFVRLSRLTDPALVLPTIAETLGLHEAGGQPLAQTLRAYLLGKRLLLVLDNFEQIVTAASEVGALLEATPGLKLLVTSRVPLRLRGEREQPLAPLPLPDRAHLPSPERLSQYAAVALFVERAQAARPDFAVTAANAPAIAEICARLDGLPLAIELAAARVKLLPPEALLARLSSQLKLLTGGARDLEERQQTMRAAIAWSEGLLSSQERVLFRRLAIFVGGCTLAAAEAVCVAPEGVEPLELDLLDGLQALVDQSLVQQREEGGEPRFGMLHVIREYALERLADAGATGGRPEADALSQAHLVYYLGLGDQFYHVELSTWSTEESRSWFDRIEREHDNFRAALTWTRRHAIELQQSRGAGDPEAVSAVEAGLRLAGDLLWFWSTRGYQVEGREWAEAFLALDTPDASDPNAAADAPESRDSHALSVRARALLTTGMLASERGDYDHVVAPLERSLALYRSIGDRQGVRYALTILGYAAEDRGNLPHAVALHEERLTFARETYGSLGAMGPLTDLAELTLKMGDLDLAQARSEEALALSLQAGNFIQQARNLSLRALIACRRGQLERAAASARKAIELLWAASDVGLCNIGLEVCAIVLAASGQAKQGREERMERAVLLLGATAAQHERMGILRRGGVPTPEEVEAAMAEARVTLGEERWATAYAAGRALSPEEAYAEALTVSHYSAILPNVVQNIATRRK